MMSEVAELLYILSDYGILLPGHGSLERQSLERELDRFLDRIDDVAYCRGEDSVSHDQCYEAWEVE